MLTILNQAKLSFKKEGKIKILSDMQRLPSLAPTAFSGSKIARRALREAKPPPPMRGNKMQGRAEGKETSKKYSQTKKQENHVVSLKGKKNRWDFSSYVGKGAIHLRDYERIPK